MSVGSATLRESLGASGWDNDDDDEDENFEDSHQIGDSGHHQQFDSPAALLLFLERQKAAGADPRALLISLLEQVHRSWGCGSVHLCDGDGNEMDLCREVLSLFHHCSSSFL